MDYYSFNRPRRDGWLSWPCWLTDSGRFTHKVVTRPAISLEQDRESSPARTGGLTTMLRHQLQLLVCHCHYLMAGDWVRVLNCMLAESEWRFCVQHGAELVSKGELIAAHAYNMIRLLLAWVTACGRSTIWVCIQPSRSTQPSTLHGMVKWVSAFELSNNKWWWWM